MSAPRLYRKRPVTIEAIKWDGEPTTLGSLLNWHKSIKYHTDGGLHIVTLEGIMRADVGDYIIKGVQGEFYPCKPDIFAATYEEL
jgi:hypothetical protein